MFGSGAPQVRAEQLPAISNGDEKHCLAARIAVVAISTGRLPYGKCSLKFNG